MLAAFLFTRPAHRIETVVVVGDAARRTLHRAPSPIGAKRTRSHGGDEDFERLQLLAQRIGDAFQGKLARAVIGDPRHGDGATHGRDVEDMPRPALAEVGQQCLGHRHGTEHVDVELVAHVIQ
ncbi:hypothetical protein D3C73_888390 [compost metagenome]